MKIPKVIKTRKGAKYPIFSSPKQLSGRNLPSYEDVMKYVLLVQQDLDSRQDLISFSEIALIVTKMIIEIWKESPGIERVLSELHRIIERYKI